MEATLLALLARLETIIRQVTAERDEALARIVELESYTE